MNYFSNTRGMGKRKIEKRIIIDFGLSYIKIGTNENTPFKLVRTPSEVFFNPEILEKNSLNIFRAENSSFKTDLHDLIQNLLFDHLMENSKELEIFVSVNALMPDYMLRAIKDTFEVDFRAKQVLLCASQTIPIMTSVGRSGIILDFGLSNISFVAFFKGFILKKHFHFFSKSGLQLLKVLYDSLYSIKENKEVLKTLNFGTKMKVLQAVLTKFVDVPDLKEQKEVLDNQTNTSKMRINRRKFNFIEREDVKLVVTYLDSYLAGNFFFDGSQSIQVQMLEFLSDMPVTLASYLVNNIVITGGLSHVKGWFQFSILIHNLN